MPQFMSVLETSRGLGDDDSGSVEGEGTDPDDSGNCDVVLKYLTSSSFNFVCDTCGWYHGGGDSDAKATAASGGCHTYKFFKNTTIPNCNVNDACQDCLQSDIGEVTFTYTLQKGSCTTCTGQ